MQDKTVVVVAHGLSTGAHLDRILVFDKGPVLEDGRHDHLLSQGSCYAQLWSQQVNDEVGPGGVSEGSASTVGGARVMVRQTGAALAHRVAPGRGDVY